MQFPIITDIHLDTAINGATFVTVIGIWGRFRVMESQVKDMWDDFIERERRNKGTENE
jgi:hypothetical protein